MPRLTRPSTGIQNPKCYAAELADCSEKMSGEHSISDAILQQFSLDGVTVEIKGLSWLEDDETKNLPTRRLKSKILCKRHNEALSGLDNVAKRFFSCIDRIDKGYGTDHDRGDRVFLFNGNDIERWMLKTLCGLVSSGNASSQSGPIVGWKPNLQSLRIVFAQEGFPTQCGLYCCGVKSGVNIVHRNFEFAPISNERMGVYGSITVLNDKRFILAMVPPPQQRSGIFLEEYLLAGVCW